MLSVLHKISHPMASAKNVNYPGVTTVLFNADNVLSSAENLLSSADNDIQSIYCVIICFAPI